MGGHVVTVSWASVLEQMLPWLIAFATVAVAIGIGAVPQDAREVALM